MKILSNFQDIIDSINKLESEKKELAHKAIDMPDWKEAQSILKKTQSEITWLKEWKQKLLDLKREYENSELCGVNVPIPSEEQPLIDNPTESAQTVEANLEEKEKQTNTDEKETNNTIEEFAEDPKEKKAETNTEKDNKEEKSFDKWYTLDSDFTNTKIKAIKIKNKIHYVKDMTDALILVCEWLYLYDGKLFKKMLNAKFVHGSRNRYLSAEPFNVLGIDGERKYKKLSNAEIYVWTNTNSNLKSNLMANMLLYYALPSDSVLLAIREDYNPAERSFSYRERQSNESNPEWTDDVPDENDYSTPVVSPKNNDKKQEPRQTLDTDYEIPDSIINPNLIIDSDEVLKTCECLILKYPFQMSLAFLAKEVGELFLIQESSAIIKFQNPQRLSNGLWVETQGVKKAQIHALEKYCEFMKGKE